MIRRAARLSAARSPPTFSTMRPPSRAEVRRPRRHEIGICDISYAAWVIWHCQRRLRNELDAPPRFHRYGPAGGDAARSPGTRRADERRDDRAATRQSVAQPPAQDRPGSRGARRPADNSRRRRRRYAGGAAGGDAIGLVDPRSGIGSAAGRVFSRRRRMLRAGAWLQAARHAARRPRDFLSTSRPTELSPIASAIGGRKSGAKPRRGHRRDGPELEKSPSR